MKKLKKKRLKFNKYPISNEFGIYRIYRIPFNERIFENANRIMALLPKTIKETKKVSFKVKNGIVIPFLNIEIPKIALKSIVIGPTNKSQLTMQSIKHMLSINEYDLHHVNLRTSNVPYRG